MATDLDCTSCLGARQFIKAHPESDVPKAHDFGAKAVVVYKGMSLCEGHFNLARGFPLDFPRTPLDPELDDKVIEDMEDMAVKIQRANRGKGLRRGGRRG